MSKTLLTNKMEKLLYSYLHRKQLYCSEVVLHNDNCFYGNEIVDFLGYSTDKGFSSYEIKVTKRDFKSSAKKSFVGNYNYYVMPRNLYEKVKNEIPKEIGCIVETTNPFGFTTLTNVKRASYKELSEYSEKSLLICLMGALYREATRNTKSKLRNAIFDFWFKGFYKQ